jgi:hypothetical protein
MDEERLRRAAAALNTWRAAILFGLLFGPSFTLIMVAAGPPLSPKDVSVSSLLIRSLVIGSATVVFYRPILWLEMRGTIPIPSLGLVDLAYQKRWLVPPCVVIGVALLTGGIVWGAVGHNAAIAAWCAALGLANLLLGAKLWSRDVTARASRRNMVILGLAYSGVGASGLAWARTRGGVVLGILLAGSFGALVVGSLSLWVTARRRRHS